MKFIHLGDLHIGKRVNDFPMIKDQEYILNQIIDVMVDEKVDAVLIAGDVYDKVVPGADAVVLFDDFLTKITKLGIKVYLISGNHDSAERLAFAKKLVENSGVYISPVFNGKVTKCVVEDEYGDINIYMLPFIKPMQVKRFYKRYLEDEKNAHLVEANINEQNLLDEKDLVGDAKADIEGDKKEPVFVEENTIEDSNTEDNNTEDNNTEDNREEIAWDNYNDVYRLVMDTIELDMSKRNVIVAHQFVTGAQTCDSEELAIGGLDNISTDNFEEFDYVALGHIHSPQKIIKETIRYSGTPLKYSLSEINHNKTVTIINMKEKGAVDVKQLPLTPLHDMRHIKGTYDELTLRDNYIETDTSDYMYITLTDEEDVPDAIGRLRSIYPNIMRLDYENTRTRTQANIEVTDRVEEKKPIELLAELFEMQNNKEMTQEQEEYVQQLIEDIWEV
ncbi:MAG: exonuclease SbcCD subunit D [Lachnospiraceae bacterium]|nr:exonuclease SbcCD subunit D [Lachnospiraceae bacterium]